MRATGPGIFRPFASAGAVNRTIVALQRAFLLRPCADTIILRPARDPACNTRSKRCSAPCVGRISEADYLQLVGEARDFLTGKSDAVKRRLSSDMQKASDRLDFELAAKLRDRIQALAQIQSRQDINVEGRGSRHHRRPSEGGHTCVQVFFFRNHGNYGNRALFPDPRQAGGCPTSSPPSSASSMRTRRRRAWILVSEQPAEVELLAEALVDARRSQGGNPQPQARRQAQTGRTRHPATPAKPWRAVWRNPASQSKLMQGPRSSVSEAPPQNASRSTTTAILRHQCLLWR